jgi:hypothetical protein
MPPDIAPPRGWLELRVGLCSERGARSRNEDYDGARGGRVAAELAVRGLIDSLLGQNEALSLRRTAGRAIEAMNGWIHAKGRTDPELAGLPAGSGGELYGSPAASARGLVHQCSNGALLIQAA